MKRGYKIGCFVVAVLLAVFAGVAVVALVHLREEARQLTCQTKVKDIVLETNLYEMVYRVLPPSCAVKETVGEDGVTTYNKDGYSFFAFAAPYNEREWLTPMINKEMPLDAENDVLDPAEGQQKNAPDEALQRKRYFFRCPCAPGEGESEITNYKAVSGSTRLAYEVSSRTDVPAEGLDIYGTGRLYTASDGVMYPGSRTTLGSIIDGTVNTFSVVETVEPTFGRWLVGQECGVYTMPDDTVFSPPNDKQRYVHPVGYVYDHYNADSAVRQATNLNRDYEKSPYPWGENGFRSARYTKEPSTGTRFGPGSAHKGVVMHGFASGNADAIPTHVDAAVYFFLTTRAGYDPKASTCGCCDPSDPDYEPKKPESEPQEQPPETQVTE